MSDWGSGGEGPWLLAGGTLPALWGCTGARDREVSVHRPPPSWKPLLTMAACSKVSPVCSPREQ